MCVCVCLCVRAMNTYIHTLCVHPVMTHQSRLVEVSVEQIADLYNMHID